MYIKEKSSKLIPENDKKCETNEWWNCNVTLIKSYSKGEKGHKEKKNGLP